VFKIQTFLLYVFCCLFLFFREKPSGGGVPGLSGLETLLFGLPYIIFLILSALNLTLVYLNRGSFPIFCFVSSFTFLIYVMWLSFDVNYNLNEGISIYIAGPFFLVIANLFVLIIKYNNKKKINK